MKNGIARTILPAILFGILGFIGNWLKVPIFLNIDFLFGSFFVMLAILRIGAGAGIMAGIIASSCTVLLWKHPWAIVIFTAEAAFVGWQARRRGTADILIYDIVYWLVCGTPLVWVFYHFVLGDGAAAAGLIMLKQSLNGIFNALLASIVHLAWQTRNADRSELPSLRQLAFTIMVSLILFPALIHIVVDLRTTMKRESEMLASRTSLACDQARKTTSLWVTEHHRIVQTFARQVGDPDAMPRKELQRLATIVNEATPAFKRMGVLDATATTIAYSPPFDENGQSNLGRNFSDRPHAKTMRDSMRPYVGDVVISRIGNPTPMLPLLAPLIVDGRYKGYCSGIVDLDEIKGYLSGISGEWPISITIVDRLDQVIVSSRGEHATMSRFVRPDGGTRQQVTGEVSHWIPPTEKGKNIMRRWQGSLYVREQEVSPDIPWKVVVESSFRPVLGSLTAATTLSLAQLAALIMVVVPLSHLFSRRLATALTQLQTATEAFPQRLATQTELPLPMSAIREVDGLVQNFRLMAASLSRHIGDLKHLNNSLEERVALRTLELDEALTTRVLAEATLRDKERHLQTIIDASPECIKLLAHDGSLLMMNHAGLAMIEADSLEQVQGECLYGLVMEPYRRDFEELTDKVFSGEAGTLEFEITGLKSGRLWLETHAVPFRNDRDEIVALLGITRDITVRKRNEQQLQEAWEAAEAANRAKGRFLANMSHELRTPMTGTLGMIELVLAEELTPRQRKNLEMSYQSASSLLRLLNDILDFARIEAGKVSFEEAPFLLEWCVKSALELFTLEAERKGLVLNLEILPGTPGMVTGDEGRVRQVLVNLIGNAMKFTERGSVTVRLTAGARDAGGRQDVTFTVTDTGIGIPREEQARVFEPFCQVDASNARAHGGAGLGLAISSEVVHQMGGTLSCSGEPGEGSAFTVTIPFRTSGMSLINEAVPQKEHLPPVPHAARCRILITEDDSFNGILLEAIIRGMGYECDIAHNGREAIEMWQQGGYALILMDVQMPQIDGIAATRLIRERERAVGGHIPIIAVTAHAFSTDRDNCLASGMDAYLAKPIDVDKFCQVLADFTRPQHPA